MMDSRVLLRIAAPLALTLVLAGVDAFGVSAPMTCSVLEAIALAWLVHAWTVLRHGTPALPVGQVDPLIQLRNFVNVEVQGSRVEIERARGLIRESVAKLGGSFEAVNRESCRQGEVVARLIDRSGDDDNSGAVDVYRFALHATRQMEQLVQALEAVGDESNDTATRIDAITGDLERIFVLLDEVRTMAEQAHRSALKVTIEPEHASAASSALADEMIKLYERSTSLHEQLHTLVPQVQDSMVRVRDAVGQRASRDLDRSCSARVEAAAMLKRVDGINCSLRHGMREIAACGSAIDASVADAVRLLQFEDIAAQSLTAASMHLDRLGTINEATTLCEPLDRSRGGGDSPVPLGQRHTLILAESKRRPHKPVRQRSMDAGSVELF